MSGPAIQEEDAQIGAAVEIDVDDGLQRRVRLGIELFDELNAFVEVPVGLAPPQRAFAVLPVPVWIAVEIAVDRDMLQIAPCVVIPPTVWRPVIILTLNIHNAYPLRPHTIPAHHPPT